MMYESFPCSTDLPASRLFTLQMECQSMTDDSNLTPGGEMTAPTVTVKIVSDSAGHWVKWVRAGDSSTLGPYVDADTAENVRAAKEHELNENVGRIDDAS